MIREAHVQGRVARHRPATAAARRNMGGKHNKNVNSSGGKTMFNKRTLGVALGALMAIGLSAGARADEPYIPLISKGFQHQFWQAVKLGAEQAAKADNVKITFEGPETEAMVDKQIDMLSAALAKKPQAHRLRRARLARRPSRS